MTASVASLGFFTNGVEYQVQVQKYKTVGNVVIGGLISATALTFVRPAIAVPRIYEKPKPPKNSKTKSHSNRAVAVLCSWVFSKR